MNKTIFLASALGLLIVAGCSSNGTQAKESSEPQVEANIAKTRFRSYFCLHDETSKENAP